MYQIYSLIGILALTWAVAIWASFPEEQNDRPDDDLSLQASLRRLR